MTHREVLVMFIGLAVLLGVARLLGELARRMNQPAVIGEILAGVLLGPTILGNLAPGVGAWLFPVAGPVFHFRIGFETFAVALFLLVAGMEVDLRTVVRQGRAAISVSLLGMIVPFAVGFLCAIGAPEIMGKHYGADPLVFALFVGTALAISALPVIARTLMDLDLFRTDLGTIIVASAIVQDVAGWIVFALILGMIETTEAGLPPAATVALTLLFSGLMITVVRVGMSRALLLVQAYASWPHGVLGFVLTFALLAAATAEWLGLHAIFGTFLAGVAVGASPHLRRRTRVTIDNFVSAVLAPLFFAGIGLKVDFFAWFDPVLVLVVMLVATVGKLVGCGFGARLAGLSDREAWAIGFGMNARGAMEIVLGLLALQNGLINERMFVALVVMALLTSVISGPLMQRTLGRRRAVRLVDVLSAGTFRAELQSRTAEHAIEELAGVVAPVAGLDPEGVTAAVREREDVMATGVSDGLAVPHARIPGLQRAIVAVGVSRAGIDFGAPDGSHAELVFLVLTPERDEGAQTDLIADISRTFHREPVRERILARPNYTELVAIARTGVVA